MDALIVYPENKEQMTALKAVMKVMKIAFEQRDTIIPEKVISGVRESMVQANTGALKPFKNIKDMIEK